ncbi:MAG: cation:proton antiporter [Acidimicrobiia bacterium]
MAVVGLILAVALRWGERLSSLLAPASDEALLLAIFGLTLLVGGLAQQLQVSAAIGAFLVGLALSGTVQARAGAMIGPLRDLFAATFFLFFPFQIRPGGLIAAALPALALTALTGARQARLGMGRRPAGRFRDGEAKVGDSEAGSARPDVALQSRQKTVTDAIPTTPGSSRSTNF